MSVSSACFALGGRPLRRFAAGSPCASDVLDDVSGLFSGTAVSCAVFSDGCILLFSDIAFFCVAFLRPLRCCCPAKASCVSSSSFTDVVEAGSLCSLRGFCSRCFRCFFSGVAVAATIACWSRIRYIRSSFCDRSTFFMSMFFAMATNWLSSIAFSSEMLYIYNNVGTIYYSFYKCCARMAQLNVLKGVKELKRSCGV